jgi:hypothetical protein
MRWSIAREPLSNMRASRKFSVADHILGTYYYITLDSFSYTTNTRFSTSKNWHIVRALKFSRKLGRGSRPVSNDPSDAGSDYDLYLAVLIDAEMSVVAKTFAGEESLATIVR